MDKNYESYQKSIETLSHLDQVVFLYYIAISHVQQAKEAIENKDYDTRFQKLNKAYTIINTLRLDLDTASNMEIVEALDDYYEAIDQMIVSVQTDNNIHTCDEIIKHLTTIKDQWETIARMQEPPDIESDNDNISLIA